MSLARPKIVLIHGFLDAGEIWRPALGVLGSLGADCLAPDLPGLGELSDDPGPFTLDRYADVVTAAIQATADPVILIGHSMGSQVAELVSQRVANTVLGLVLLSPIPLAGTQMSGPMIDALAAAGGDEDAQRGVRNSLVAQPADEKVLAWLTSLGKSVRRSATEQIVAAWNSGVAEGRKPSSFQGPVLVASGDRDQFVTQAMATAVAGRFKNVTQIWLHECGHWPQAERPDLIGELLRFFINNCCDKAAAGEGSDGWKKAFSEQTEKSFGQTFSESVVFEATVLTRRVEGIERVKTILGAASRLYSKLDFTRTAKNGNRSYMEWEADVIGGGHVAGITILTTDPDGKIASIAIHHRPLSGVLHFSTALARDLKGKIEPDMFFHAS